MDREKLRQAIEADSYEWRKHALQRMAQRGITQEEAISVLGSGEIIEEYPTSQPYPSALFFGKVGTKAIHAVAALDESVPWVYIVTVYEPDLEHFEADLKTRR